MFFGLQSHCPGPEKGGASSRRTAQGFGFVANRIDLAFNSYLFQII